MEKRNLIYLMVLWAFIAQSFSYCAQRSSKPGIGSTFGIEGALFDEEEIIPSFPNKAQIEAEFGPIQDMSSAKAAELLQKMREHKKTAAQEWQEVSGFYGKKSKPYIDKMRKEKEELLKEYREVSEFYRRKTGQAIDRAEKRSPLFKALADAVRDTKRDMAEMVALFPEAAKGIYGAGETMYEQVIEDAATAKRHPLYKAAAETSQETKEGLIEGIHRAPEVIKSIGTSIYEAGEGIAGEVQDVWQETAQPAIKAWWRPKGKAMHRLGQQYLGVRRKSPVAAAVLLQDIGLVKKEIANGNDVNQPDEFGQTPLHWAIAQYWGNNTKDQIEIIEALVSSNADMHATNDIGLSPLSYAVQNGRIAELVQLLRFKPDLNKLNAQGNTLLDTAVKRGDNNTISLLLNNGADPNIANSEGNMPLHVAVRNNDRENAQLLLQKGADINAQDDLGFTALHLAPFYGGKGMVETLVEFNPNFEVKSSTGQTAINLAAKYGKTDAASEMAKAASRMKKR